MSKITAVEARKLAGPTVQEHVDEVYLKIREAAIQKQREIRLSDSFWADGGYSKSTEWKQACEILTADGYKVNFYYAEMQFVDMGTMVSW